MRRVNKGWYTTKVIGFDDSFMYKVPELHIDVHNRNGGWELSYRNNYELVPDNTSHFLAAFYYVKNAKQFAEMLKESLLNGDDKFYDEIHEKHYKFDGCIVYPSYALEHKFHLLKMHVEELNEKKERENVSFGNTRLHERLGEDD